MWIIPNNLSDTYPSVLDTKDLGLHSDEFSQASEKSLMWRGKHGPSRTWRTRWKRESYIQHLSGRTLRHSHSDSFVERWTSSLEDSPVPLSVLLGVAREYPMNGTSTHSSAQGSGSASQQLSFSKTSPESSQQELPMERPFSNMSSKTWKAWVTQQRQESLARKKLAHLIEETGYSSWPTPRTVDARSANQPRKDRGVKPIAHLNAAVKQENWPTPTTDTAERTENYAQGGTPLSKKVKKENWMTPEALNHTGYQVSGGKRIPRLGAQVNQENWPTPTTAEAGKIGNQANFGQTGLSNHPAIRGETERGKMLKSREGDGRSTQPGGPPAPDTISTNGKSHGQLNPNWVEQLMGIPVGWTQLSTEWTGSE